MVKIGPRLCLEAELLEFGLNDQLGSQLRLVHREFSAIELDAIYDLLGRVMLTIIRTIA